MWSTRKLFVLFNVYFSDVRYGKISYKENGSDIRDQWCEVPGPEAKKGPEMVFPPS